MVGRKLDARVVDAMFAFHLLPTSHAKECSRPECSNPCLHCKPPTTVKKQLFSCVRLSIKTPMYDDDELSESAGDILVGAECIRMSGMLAQPGEREMRD